MEVRKGEKEEGGGGGGGGGERGDRDGEGAIQTNICQEAMPA